MEHRQTRPGSRARTASTVLMIPVIMMSGACGDSISGPQGDSCGPPPYFTVLPVAESEIDLVGVIGGLGAPGHTLPTAHTGIALTREDVPFRSPGDIAVTELRRVRYNVSPTRQGEEDYAIFFQVCKQLTGWFGHIVTLAPSFSPATIDWDDCETYSTSDETVQACTAAGLDIKIAAGDPLGTGGLDAERGFLAVDFGMLDDRVFHSYISPGRFPSPTFHAVCPWDQFDASNREILYSKLTDPGRPEIEPSGEPRCGTMEVDVPGTAAGVWAETGVTGRVEGNETRYITLANYPYRPVDELALSLGPAVLGAGVYTVPRRTSGRVNRAFDQVSDVGMIYCYGPDESGSPISWFLSLPSANSLRIERVDHAPGGSPCGDDPSTWTHGANAQSMVR